MNTASRHRDGEKDDARTGDDEDAIEEQLGRTLCRREGASDTKPGEAGDERARGQNRTPRFGGWGAKDVAYLALVEAWRRATDNSNRQ